MAKKHIHLLAVLAVIAVLGMLLGLAPHRVEADRSADATISVALNVPAQQAVADAGSALASSLAEEIIDIPWQTVTVRRGDSLSHIFSRLGFSARELQEIVALDEATQRLQKLYPDQVIKVKATPEGRLQELGYDIDDSQSLHVYRTPGGLQVKTVQHVLDRHIRQASGVIDSSLFLAAQNAGLSENLTMQLASIFGWDVDFALDIRAGDSFAVIYEEYSRYGKKVRDGAIVAAEFISRGKAYQAVRYTDAAGNTEYFTPDGKSVRKTFLRTPVDFARVSSRFNLNRKHPVLNRIRAHRGVDYAAPTGTPIKAAGDGKVIFKGTNGGFGRSITIQHGAQYTTLYAHLSRYTKGIDTGSRVRQGQVIGYVGQSGLATGPHLHYEFRVNGVHRNPLTVKLPDAAPIDEKYKADFLAVTQPLIAQLDVLNPTAVAFNE